MTIELLIFQTLCAIYQHSALDALQLDSLLLFHIVAVQNLAHSISVGQFCQLLFRLSLGSIVGFSFTFPAGFILFSQVIFVTLSIGENFYFSLGFLNPFGSLFNGCCS